MTSSNSLEGREWIELAYLEESEREPVMKSRYEELASLSEEERRSHLASMERAVYELPDDRIRSFTISRLRTWLNMEHDPAQKISLSFDAITGQFSGSMAMRHVEMVQTMAREFPLADQTQLKFLFPRIFGALESVAEDTDAPAKEVSAPPKKAWWAFWKR